VGVQGALGLGTGGAGGRELQTSPVPDHVSPPPVPSYGTWTSVPGQSAEITPVANFYYVSKNFVSDPAIDAATWRLAVTGMVRTPLSLTYEQLRALPRFDQQQTLECISNEVGGDLMSNAVWTGASLADLLLSAGLLPGASLCVFRCADQYSDSLHLTQALSARAKIVYAIEGQPLPQAHGFPARLLVPGLYGMKNGKWLTQLEVTQGRYAGYWEQRGWTPEAVVKLTARIDVPQDGDVLAARPTLLAGVAFAGDQGIAQVDVSTDAGRSWTPAALKRPLGDLTWVLWEAPWTPTVGTHVLAVRAVDLSGRIQTPHVAPPLPDGASGYHAVQVNVG
jgi:DMSO/TMAO reductase YedYZ molybdopterin-dependent catalytic subunit